MNVNLFLQPHALLVPNFIIMLLNAAVAYSKLLLQKNQGAFSENDILAF